METKQNQKIGELVGRKDDSYYVCDTIFKHADDFKGATATVLVPVSEDDHENRTDPYNSDTTDRFRECWVEQVKAGQTDRGLEDWVEEILAVDGDEAVFDFSGHEYWDLIRKAVPELTEEAYPVFECIGGGRSFSPDMEWDEIYNPQLWEKIKIAESD